MKGNSQKTKYDKALRLVPELQNISALVRQQNTDFKNPSDEVIFNTTLDVLAPTLNSFVLYVLNNARKKGIRTLYFLARDAYFMYLCADRYSKAYKLDIKCKYLCVSRYSLRVPLYHKDMKRALEFITLGGLDVTPIKVLNRAGLDRNLQSKILERIESRFSWKEDQQIPRDRLSDLKEFLSKDQEFINLLETNSKDKYVLLMDYLRQEEFDSKEKIAIVDSGWVGSIQQSLNEARKLLGINTPIEGYYFGIYELPKGVSKEHYHSYYFGPESHLRKIVDFSNCLFEGVFSAPHGMTLFYREEDDKVRAIFSQIAEKRKEYLTFEESIFNLYQDEVLNMKIGFRHLYDLFNSYEAKELVEKLLVGLMARPSREEAEVYGQMDFSDDVLDYGGAVLAEPMDEKDLSDNHVLNRIIQEVKTRLTGKKPVIRQSAWYEGSAMLYSKKKSKVRHHWKSYRTYKYLMQYRKRQQWFKSNY